MPDTAFPQRLEIVMGDRNRSAFAKLCEVKESSLRAYLGGSKPGMENLVQIADATGASIEWLATGRGSPFPTAKLVEITPSLAQKLTMKEEYVQAIFIRIYTMQDETGARMNADTFYFALSMIHQVMLDKFAGEDVTDEQMEVVLSEYVDKLIKQAGWFKNS